LNVKMEKIESVGKSTPPSPLTPLPGDELFPSPHAALKFAFNFTHGTLKRPSINVLAGKGGGPIGRGLVGLDGAAQAGMVRAELEALAAPDHEGRARPALALVRRNIITARFAPESEPCSCRSPCCRGVRDAGEWRAAIVLLVEFVLLEGLGGTKSHYRLRQAVVHRYFGRHESLIAIAETCHVNRDTASELNKRVVERFRSEERQAMDEITTRLRRSGIVPS
jgi:hypothetical protein